MKAPAHGQRPRRDFKDTLSRWVREFQADPEGAFGDGEIRSRDREIEELRSQVRELKAENAFLRKSLAYFRPRPSKQE